MLDIINDITSHLICTCTQANKTESVDSDLKNDETKLQYNRIKKSTLRIHSNGSSKNMVNQSRFEISNFPYDSCTENHFLGKLL